MRRALIFALVAACGGAQKPAPPPKATLAFTGVRVFDGERVLPEAVVLVDGDHISAVGPGVPVPPGVEIVDGRGKTLMPGLIDGHVHMYDPSQLVQSLAFGVTTNLDMFMPTAVIETMKAPTPGRADIFTAGTLATAPGGHGTEYGFVIPTLTAPEQAAAFVDARLAEGSDWIKIVHDDGAVFGLHWPTLSPAVVAALATAAHAHGKLAVAHIGSYQDAHEALEAGVDGLVHLFRDRMPPPDFGAYVASKKAFVTPTLVALRILEGGGGALAADPTVATYLAPDALAMLKGRAKVKVNTPSGAAAAAVAQLRDAGVPILAGTDVGNPGIAAGASLHEELVLLVEAGLTPAQALAAATSAPARAFRLADRGRIAVGLRADLVLVDGDPTTDIKRTRALAGIWRAGVRFDREAYRASLPAPPQPGERALPGLVSDFNDGTMQARLGSWTPSTDKIVGGTSTVDVKVVDKALSISGEVVPGKAPVSWGGAMLMPGSRPFAATDLSASKGVRFRARGDGKTYVVMVFATRLGGRPSAQTFTAGPKETTVDLAWSGFDGLDGSDTMGIMIAQSATPGKFALVVDDVELR